jgi:hypothetical protein
MVDEITPKLVKATLKKIKSIESLPKEMLDIHLLGDARLRSYGEREIQLQKIILDFTRQLIIDHRKIEGIECDNHWTQTRSSLIENMKLDLKTNSKGSRLAAWSVIYHRYLSPVPLSAAEIARSTSFTRRQIDYISNEGCKLLVAYLRKAEIEARAQEQRVNLTRHIPSLEGAGIFGGQELAEEIETLLFDDPGVKVVSIEGLGGIGKTTMAQRVALSAANRGVLEDVLWISVRQMGLPLADAGKKLKNPVDSLDDLVNQLADLVGHQAIIGLSIEAKIERMRRLFNSTPYLIVCDNLETASDCELIPQMFDSLLGETLVLFTSRCSSRQHPFVYSRSVPELSFAESRALVQHELKRGKRAMKITDSQMTTIYETVGGLPLALKLVAGQLDSFSVEECLDGLSRIVGQDVQKMFNRIYLRIWTQLLDDEAKKLLLSLLSINPDGSDLDWVKQMSRHHIAEQDFNDKLEQLQNYSLVQVSGTVSSPVYSLHRTTVVFLNSEILLR